MLNQCLLSALNLINEPLIIVGSETDRCYFANHAFFQLVEEDSLNSGFPCFADFWPEYPKLDLSCEELRTEFRNKKDQVFSVDLIICALDEGYKLIKVVVGANGDVALGNFHAQRLETLGMLAGGIAHDFNNILAGILGHITYLKTILPGSGAHVESLGAIEDGAKKASGMTQQILNFSKLDTEEKPDKVDLCALALSTSKLLRGAIPPCYELKCDVCEDPALVLGVEGKLAQVLANLVINSRDAIQQNGTIEIKVAVLEQDEVLKSLFGSQELSSRAYVAMKVIDDGEGMSERVLKRVFEPYFSTKKKSGTGLGLATVNAIVQSLGGVIDIQSKVGEGTSVSIYLPMVDLEGLEETEESARSAVTLSGGDERILVVDDEYAVRNVLAMSLQHLGYKVDTASSGKEAIQLFQECNGNVDLVILDMLMPQIPGEEVFSCLCEMDPQVRVLIISGYSSEEAVQKVLDEGGKDFIQKPFTIEQLSKKVRECLDS